MIRIADAGSPKPATNKVRLTATNTVATNEPVATNSDVAKTDGERTPNRRDREAYNAYQRDYMRKRRASQKS